MFELNHPMDEIIENLYLGDLESSEDVNKLLNTVAGSVNYRWDSYNLGKIVGFQSDEIKCSDDLIPLPIQSLYYVSSLTYGYLVRCAINAMILKYEVLMLIKKPSETASAELEQYKQMLDRQKALEDQCKEMNKQLKQITKGQENIQKNVNESSKRLETKIENRNNVEKTKALKPSACLKEIKKILKDARLEIHEPSIKKRLSSWNTFIRTKGEKGSEPLAGYDYAVHQTPSYFKDWVLETFLPDYRERMRNNCDVLKNAIHGLKILG